MKKILLFILIISFVFSCKQQTKETKTTKSTITSQQLSTKDSKTINYPSISIELIQKLFAEVNYMDYIFNDLNFSLSQEKKSSIQKSLTFISTDVPNHIPNGCKSIGRKFFHIDGVIVLEADLYFSNNCAFYLFYIEGKATYANVLTKEGINFYNNIVKSGQKQR